MDNQLMEQIMAEVMKNIDKPREAVKEVGNCEAMAETSKEANKVCNKSYCSLTEFVGTAIGDTIGFVIANVDYALHEMMKIDKKYRSIGIIGARTGAGPQIMAADEAVKATNTEIISVELARDTKGGAGHGSLILFGAEDVSDARRAVEVALKELDRTFGDVYGNDAGHLEFQYTARASYACNKAFNAPVGKAFGLIVGAPAAIGVLIADTAVKSANVDIIGYASPADGTSYSNEVIVMVSGDSGAVRQAIIAAREVGIQALQALGDKPTSTTTPYI
ncbi:MAG: propanediol utilization microcompartment protein PduB [Maledivibacter sp.]|nr:propanediol utilization microcompartment protein PduB [Maledivibacter sp.]